MDIADLRKRIDEIDDSITALFTERMQISAKIGDYKIQNGMKVFDPKREQEIIDVLSSKTEKIFVPYIQALYSDIFDMSRRLQTQIQEVSAIEYGLIGKNVSYSYAKWIHHAMKNSSYGLYETPEELLPIIFDKRAFKGLNISSPYRKDVIEYCNELDFTASETGYVNTIVKEVDNSLKGYNTTYDGILFAANKAGINFKDKKVIILGNGSFSAAANAVAKDSGARDIVIVSRTGSVNFRNFTQHKDAEIMINATSIGMTPNDTFKPADLRKFPNICGVLDAVYTPVNSAFINDAKELGIPCESGLLIYIRSCAKSSDLFGFKAENNICYDLYDELTTFIE